MQGEGAQAGRAAVFCRFSKCNLWTGREKDRANAVCSFCETDFVGTDGQNGGQFETADALAAASFNIARTIATSAIVCYTSSGSTARRMARERPSVPLLVLTPNRHTARRVGLLWGAYAVVTRDVSDFEEMIAKAKRMALRHKLGEAGSRLIVCAGVPFGTPGSTNLLHVVRLSGDELKRS